MRTHEKSQVEAVFFQPPPLLHVTGLTASWPEVINRRAGLVSDQRKAFQRI